MVLVASDDNTISTPTTTTPRKCTLRKFKWNEEKKTNEDAEPYCKRRRKKLIKWRRQQKKNCHSEHEQLSLSEGKKWEECSSNNKNSQQQRNNNIYTVANCIKYREKRIYFPFGWVASQRIAEKMEKKATTTTKASPLFLRFEGMHLENFQSQVCSSSCCYSCCCLFMVLSLLLLLAVFWKKKIFFLSCARQWIFFVVIFVLVISYGWICWL